MVEKTEDEKLAELLNDPIFNVSAEAASLFDVPAYMKEADCPDKLCVHMKKISQVNETIVCLPNQVILTIEKK